MATQLDGPRLAPRGRTPDALVVLLHGYGANGDDLIGLADGWRERLPGAAFVAPNAPETIPGMPGSLQWFPLTLRDPTEYWRGVVAATAGRRPLPRCRAGALSAGCRTVWCWSASARAPCWRCMSGLRRPVAPAAIVGFSGLLAGPEHLAEATGRPPILLIHGEVDDLIPVDVIHIAREQLAERRPSGRMAHPRAPRTRHRPGRPAASPGTSSPVPCAAAKARRATILAYLPAPWPRLHIPDTRR